MEENVTDYGSFTHFASTNQTNSQKSHGLLVAAEELQEKEEEVVEEAEELEELPVAENEALSENQEAPQNQEIQQVSFEEFFGTEKNKAALEANEELKKELEAEKEKIEAEKLAVKQKLKDEEKAKKEKERANRPKNPIGMKLIGIVSILLLTALVGVTIAVSYFTSEDIKASSEENNLSINSRTMSDSENRIERATASTAMFFDLLKTAGNNEAEIRTLESMFFSRNSDIIAIYSPADNQIFLNTSFLAANEKEESLPQEFFAQATDELQAAQDGDFLLSNATPFFSIPVMAIYCPIGDKSAGILYSLEKMIATFSAGSVNQSFLVNAEGKLLVHNDIQALIDGTDESNNPIVHAMMESSISNSQITYKGEDGEEYIGAFRKLPNGNGAVITTVKTSIVLEGVKATTRRNIYITLAILSAAIMIVYFFAQSLSRPLKALTAVANEINQGNFNTDLFQALIYKGKDEIGILEKSTKNERNILNTVSKLTNKGVTKAIITNEIDFEPHLKDITIFFSDIRGFTAISDGFKNRFGQKSAAEIINFLNDYMSRMVMCITLTGGVVDKFEGDAIMACWGVLRHDDLEWESKGETSVTRVLKQEEHDKYVKADALSAITCCIAMRYSLAKYNKDAEAFTKAHKDEPLAQYKPHIRIGAGLNSGRATVGFMGSFEKMEFTSIGDAVNFASRTEASNKPCGTDILITEDTYNLLKQDYIRCFDNDFTLHPKNRKYEITVEKIPVGFEVKGKGTQYFYGVVNMPRFDIEAFFKQADPDFELDVDCEKVVGPFGPRNLKEMREVLGIAEPDFGQVNLNEEENKIKVSSN